MDALSSGMLAFKNGLTTYLPKIKKVTGLDSAEIVPHTDGTFIHSFSFVGRWSYPHKGEYRRGFTRALVFGRYLQAVSPIPVMRPCDVKSELIRDITNLRLREANS